MFRNKRLYLFIVLPVLLVLTGCGPAKPAALSNTEVVVLTSEVLTALEEGDYERFTQSFSEEMLAAFPESGFADLRNLLQTNSGGFVSCGEEVDLTNNQGYAVYRLRCTYEKEDVVVTIVFKVDGTQVDGLFFDSPNLRAASK